jgi:acyl-CoA synthetase (NDP forming)
MERTGLDALLNARSIAIIGASNSPEALSGRPLGLLAEMGYSGRIFPVNPNRSEVQGRRAYASILDVPDHVDAAMIAVRAELVPQALRECVAAGVGSATIVSSGFGEGQGHGEELLREIEQIVGSSSMRVVGPNCEGVLSMPNSMPLTFSPAVGGGRTGMPLRAGKIAVISQSGGLGFAIAQWGTAIGLGFSHIITTGNELDVDVLDATEYLLQETDAEVLVIVAEAFDQQRFAKLAGLASTQDKAFVVAKLGRTSVGARGALAHTRHDSGDAAEYAALVESVGAVLTTEEDELIDAIQIVSRRANMKGRRVAVVTTSGGSGVWVSDACVEAGFEVPRLSPALQRRLATHMPGYGSPVNPVDLTAQFFAEGNFAPVLEALFESGEIDAILLVTSLASPTRLDREREGLARVIERFDMPLIVHSYTRTAQACLDVLTDLDLPHFESARRTVRALSSLAAASARRSSPTTVTI